jgi:pyridoxamine 5'-phosphate oxidase family protein
MKTGLARREVAFTDEEVAFLTQSRLARVATATCDGQPHVVPVVYEFDGSAFYFAGWNLEKSLKFRNLLENERVALVVDDLVSVCPWRPRGVEVRGVAEPGREGDLAYVKVTPLVKRSWGF